MAKKKKFYICFYDEAFHDRKITESKEKGQMNIEQKENGDNFFTAKIIFLEHQHEKYIRLFNEFENQAKEILGIDSSAMFKGTTINKPNFKNGVSSFNEKTLEIYNNFFDLIDNNWIFQISVMNKLEHVINSIFSNSSISLIADEQAFRYSLSKFLNHYRNEELISVLFDSDSTISDIYNCIMNLLDDVENNISGIKRKEKEERAIREIRTILSNSLLNLKSKEKYEWDYSHSLNGLVFLLEEKKIKIKSVNLIIDREERTEAVAKRFFNFKSVKSVKSKDCSGVRIADIFSNFVGRFVKAIEDEYLEDWDNPDTKAKLAERRILNTEWFNLTNEQFDLYVKIANVFYDRKDIFWTVQTGLYWGHFGVFISLLYYFLTYDNFDEYQSYSYEEHREQFNLFCLQREEQMHQR
ncbi:hypothetical protein [Vagococcus xieshaowenii]|uniref:DUF3800 domain-containing protein n=1 Tax=Vagococcus xieshaowenii TaxID=2562451 RepID=A0AAJ5EDM1_9ENTE|nr:hypothetical protein [Vagococcus xieshaowenii]QCA28741.1 hypothetical protein E4Z98_05205 [Vagococcus xieshaowenii]TFZ40451.1 hypothetical protein E4031_06570 [Vagococcus xieshaowenii]